MHLAVQSLEMQRSVMHRPRLLFLYPSNEIYAFDSIDVEFGCWSPIRTLCDHLTVIFTLFTVPIVFFFPLSPRYGYTVLTWSPSNVQSFVVSIA
jgi:hypothetical protein